LQATFLATHKIGTALFAYDRKTYDEWVLLQHGKKCISMCCVGVGVLSE